MRKKAKPRKPCEACSEELAIRTERFCKHCKEKILTELAESGYLTDPKEGAASIREKRDRPQIDVKSFDDF